MRKKKPNRKPFLAALAVVILVALGVFAGHWWALRKPMVCACYSQCIMPPLQIN